MELGITQKWLRRKRQSKLILGRRPQILTRNKLRIEGGNAKARAEAARTTVQAESPKVVTASKYQPDSSEIVRRRGSSGLADNLGRQGRTHNFNSSDFQLSINNEGHFARSPFTIDNLDLGKDFRIDFRIKSTRNGGSTRYGIAWNYSPDDFLLFTIHSKSAEYYSIGPGKKQNDGPVFTVVRRLHEHQRRKGNSYTFQIAKRGSVLFFSINGNEVWRTSSYSLTSNKFAFWIADFGRTNTVIYSLPVAYRPSGYGVTVP